MEIYTTTWTITSDEIKVLAEILQLELHRLEASHYLNGGAMETDGEEWRRATVRHMYNQLIRML